MPPHLSVESAACEIVGGASAPIVLLSPGKPGKHPHRSPTEGHLADPVKRKLSDFSIYLASDDVSLNEPDSVGSEPALAKVGESRVATTSSLPVPAHGPASPQSRHPRFPVDEDGQEHLDNLFLWRASSGCSSTAESPCGSSRMRSSYAMESAGTEHDVEWEASPMASIAADHRREYNSRVGSQIGTPICLSPGGTPGTGDGTPTRLVTPGNSPTLKAKPGLLKQAAHKAAMDMWGGLGANNSRSRRDSRRGSTDSDCALRILQQPGGDLAGPPARKLESRVDPEEGPSDFVGTPSISLPSAPHPSSG
mmetsp:Transcript_3055/g.6044  ORF Transcript_3055/g.6044 Transcript_3055/m.6044 type:complete len:308 (+) Transcript_3055:123-1046(+)|eukprot:CAMPEP_0173379518 /NCGR_PEP_ID=MMETSP1356-20130122/2430_1 /TAXON_ID=77927 ORGANISM="Hemiselmis virescens, Strain PCC157" /NCGR_SAMPLE_ID=MMETSP1356 /ASSEMBLY_ACC=CAM_ASM_000847 /LENGTH=307 /DNA_ID=CAMNT_0014332863 /DNA_START=112 /DNA_END=1035 /DNA_ORIENTATION=-